MKEKLVKFKDFLLRGLSPAMRWSLLVTFLVGLGFGVIGLWLNMRPYGFWSFFVFLVIFIAAGLVLSGLIALMFTAVKKMRWQTVMVMTSVMLLSINTLTLAMYLVPMLILLAIAVYFAVMFATKKYATLALYKKVSRGVMLGVSSLGVLVFAIIIFWPGPALSPDLRPETARLALPYPQNVHQLDFVPLKNPGLRGQYNFDTFSYAIPGVVDATDMLAGWSGMRYSHLGFDYSAMPLNAQVWMPQGSGPFPIALMVHGNHTAGVSSYHGYDYLGEHLASRGIIAASIDQTFLNGSMLYDIMFLFGLETENAVRGYVMLHHLQHWYDNYQDMVDWERIVLIGHSRGGEAVALAAMLADLTHYPGNGMVELNFPFSINTVVAIAPTHRQYDPAGLEVYLTGINYLAIHGGHDKDVSSFQGADMYRRVCVANGGMKARVWLQHANHGQFNSIWINDSPGLMNLTGNRRMLMSIKEQQMAAKVLIGAFLEATLFERIEYTALFRYFSHGEKWLPATYYVMDFVDHTMIMLDDFDTGFNLAQSASGLVTYRAYDLSGWTVMPMPARFDEQNRVLQLQWGEDNRNPAFFMDFDEGVVTAGDVIYMSLTADTHVDIGFYVRLTNTAGDFRQIHINEFGGVPSPITTPMFTPIFQSLVGNYEPVLQILAIPTERFGLTSEIANLALIMETADSTKTLFIDDLRVSSREGATR
ncbi:MAG: hypothetical protein FWB74_04100 [Defluviitaleaceae bacterium]|nr:hypothetical protein [Defluviitaleaceae bacterium]